MPTKTQEYLNEFTFVCDTYCFVALPVAFWENESKNKRLVMWLAYHMHMCIYHKVKSVIELQANNTNHFSIISFWDIQEGACICKIVFAYS